MSDYFTEFSFMCDLPNEEAATNAVELFKQIERLLEGEFDADNDGETPWPEELERFKQYEFSPGVAIEQEGAGLWIHDDSGGPNIEMLTDYLQLVLQKYDPDGTVGFAWSGTASKKLLDAFGGGAVFISAKDIEWIDTWGWLSEQSKKREAAEQKTG